ncbi:MAG: hypothetical protein IPP91_11330 [Betaproteobacteria bacterium]|nr:hypothetical protein [Betaproteobacteria bacterium]
MPRKISTALDTELAKTITSVGYLIEMVMSSTLRMSNLGTVSWDGYPWVGVDFSLDNMEASEAGRMTPSLAIQNLDSAMAALFLTDNMADVRVTCRQFARGALGVADVVTLFTLAVGEARIGLKEIVIQLVPEMNAAFSPRRRVDPSFGFSYALPRGSQVAWENEIFTTEAANG